MADASEILKDVELTDEVKSKLVEKLNPVFSNYETQLVESKNKLDEAIQTRQKAKEKADELERQIVSGSAQSQELLTAKQKEIERLGGDLQKITTEKDELTKITDEIQTERKKELLSKMPEGKLRESLNKISDLKLLSEQIEAILENIPDKSSSFNGRGGGKIIKDGAKWDGYTSEEKEELRKKHFDTYDKLYYEKYGRHASKE
jgi:chromosome segregation ATPase